MRNRFPLFVFSQGWGECFEDVHMWDGENAPRMCICGSSDSKCACAGMGRMLRGCAYVVAAIASVLPLTGWLLDRQSRACVPARDDLNLSLPAFAGLSRDGSHSLQINLRDGRSLDLPDRSSIWLCYVER
eukprot:g77795.t1